MPSYNFGRCPAAEIAVQWNRSDVFHLTVNIPYTRSSVNFTLTVGECVLQFDVIKKTNINLRSASAVEITEIFYGIPYADKIKIDDIPSKILPSGWPIMIFSQLPFEFDSNNNGKSDRIFQVCRRRKMYNILDNKNFWTTVSLQQIGFNRATLRIVTAGGSLKEYHPPNVAELSSSTESVATIKSSIGKL
ncbi:hypothetical protein M3Y98_01220200 [Aphelenchoides besseyi]|nr:hypothetical protein M3Y98_01220200 [Aphelenchoides besseyi]